MHSHCALVLPHAYSHMHTHITHWSCLTHCTYTHASHLTGSFFTKYPRHRTLISINKRNTGIWGIRMQCMNNNKWVAHCHPTVHCVSISHTIASLCLIVSGMLSVAKSNWSYFSSITTPQVERNQWLECGWLEWWWLECRWTKLSSLSYHEELIKLAHYVHI